MAPIRSRRAILTDRINALVGADKPLRELAGNLSKIAKYAIDEANSLSLERIEVKLPRLPKKLDGLKIIHLSDIHHSPFTGLDHINRAIKVANRLRPDIVLLTGDYVSHEAEYIKPVAEALSALKAEYGVHACLGNHDHWTDPEMITSELRNVGINVLINTGERIDIRGVSVWLAGVDDHMVGKTDLQAALKGSFPDEFKLLMAHNPLIFRKSVREDIDLTLSGHTHGGQVKVRTHTNRNRLLPRRKLTAGLHQRKNSSIYITRGIGTVVLPIRYQCPPEISLLELWAA